MYNKKWLALLLLVLLIKHKSTPRFEFWHVSFRCSLWENQFAAVLTIIFIWTSLFFQKHPSTMTVKTIVQNFKPEVTQWIELKYTAEWIEKTNSSSIMSSSDSLYEYLLCGCGILCCTVFGLVGNISTILLFKWGRMQMNRTFTNLVIWLAAIDSCFLVTIRLTSLSIWLWTSAQGKTIIHCFSFPPTWYLLLLEVAFSFQFASILRCISYGGHLPWDA